MAKELNTVAPETDDGPKLKKKMTMKKSITVTEGTVTENNTLATLTHNEEMVQNSDDELMKEVRTKFIGILRQQYDEALEEG